MAFLHTFLSMPILRIFLDVHESHFRLHFYWIWFIYSKGKSINILTHTHTYNVAFVFLLLGHAEYKSRTKLNVRSTFLSVWNMLVSVISFSLLYFTMNSMNIWYGVWVYNVALALPSIYIYTYFFVLNAWTKPTEISSHSYHVPLSAKCPVNVLCVMFIRFQLFVWVWLTLCVIFFFYC